MKLTLRFSWCVSLILLAVAGPLLAQAGAPAGAEFRVNTYTTLRQGGPSVASDSSGNFVVVWQSDDQDGSNSGVFGQRYGSAGTPIGAEFRVSTYTTQAQTAPSVASDTAGNFVVVWESPQESSYGIFGQRYASTGAPAGTEFRVNTYTTQAQTEASVSSDFSGNFVVVWTSYRQDGSSFGVFGQRFASSGAPVGAEFRVNTYTTSFQRSPSVASDSSGNFVVAWTSYTEDGSRYGVFGQRYASLGAPLGAEFRVNTYTTNFQSSPRVTSDSSGNFVVVWESYGQDGQSWGVFGQRYASSGAPAGAEFQVNSYTTNLQRFPSVASDSSGNFVVVWESQLQDGSLAGVFGRRYASSGSPAGTEFRVNTFTTSRQSSSSVASDSSGDFVVVWEAGNQDGSNYGVFGQRYGRIADDPLRLLLSHGRVQVSVDWRSQYSGQSGAAFAIPQQDGFGFFYFTDPGNPEVFVKVLDFGQGGALCFVGGLSDFYYKVTFKTVRTGQTLVFEKPAGAYVGFADNGTLRFGRPGEPGISSKVNTAGAASVVAGFLPFGEAAPGRALISPAAAAQSLDLSQGRVQVVVEWRSQYSGESGTAYAIPQQDGFGFFYFTDPGNPEVFVKVLDFGQGGALCFVGGLSDFFYRVTFKTLRTGQTLVFEKPAGLYVGFADNGTLRF